MSSKKKRNKVYKGSNAAARPTITRVNAVNRNKVHQWWVDHERAAKPALKIGGVAAVIILILVGLASLIW